MSTEDKTGDNLVASIRKTKSGAAGAATKAPSAATAPATDKPAPRRRTAAKAGVKSGSGGSAKRSTGDSYQSPGRIWPD